MRNALPPLVFCVSTILTACSDHGAPPGQPAPSHSITPEAAASAATDAATPAGPAALDGGVAPAFVPSAQVTLAEGVRIDEVSIFQGTKTVLERGGQRNVTRAVPVVAGRDALIRVYASPTAQRPQRPVTGELTIVRQGAVVGVLRESVNLVAPSREEDPSTTFDFDLPGAIVQSDTDVLVRLVDPSAPMVASNTQSPAQYPQSGTPDSLSAEHVLAKLRVVIVPLRYGFDGSNRLPDTGPAVLDAIHKRMLEYYPVPDVEVSVRQPLQWNKAILENGAGWDDMLDAVQQLRMTDNVPLDVYYYAAFAPKPTYDQYCTNECLTGLSNFADTIGDAAGRSSSGVLYPISENIDTVPHEIGHAHGQQHAPCGQAPMPDPNFPYPDGRTGAWGYSIVTKTLKPPTYFDQMGYCTPAWQSQYVYHAFFTRERDMASLRVGTPNGGAPSGTSGQAGARTYRMAKVEPDGTVRWRGEPFETTTPVVGKPHRVRFFGDSGQVVGEDIAHGYAFDHLAGGTLIVPYERGRLARRVQVDLERPPADVLVPLRGRLGQALEIEAER
jgi:hypothetical protein